MLNPKKKYAERFLDKIFTDGERVAVYNGVALTTASGLLTSKTLTNVHIA